MSNQLGDFANFLAFSQYINFTYLLFLGWPATCDPLLRLLHTNGSFHRVLPQLQEGKEHKLDMARITKVSPATNVYFQFFFKLSMFREFQEINFNLF